MSQAARFALFVSVVLSVWTLEHLYVGWRLWSIPVMTAPTARRALLLLLAIAFSLYPLGRIVFAAGAQTAGRVLEYTGALWMGTLLLLVAALFVVDVITLGGLVLRPWVGALRTGAVVVALIAAAVAWVGGFRQPRLIDHEVRLRGLPAAADGFVLLQLSDLHLGTITGARLVNAVLDTARQVQPDAVLITGDLVDADAGAVEHLVPLLRQLRAPHGVFAVHGNHEFYAGRERSRKLLEAAGFTVLDNQAVELVPGLWLAGVPDAHGAAQTGAPAADLDAALAQVPSGAALVLLQHSPEQERRAAAAGVGLMLNGHTHGGQIWPFHLLVCTSYQHIAGRREVDGMTQIVSRGTGQWGPPMRLLAPSDMIRIVLRQP